MTRQGPAEVAAGTAWATVVVLHRQAQAALRNSVTGQRQSRDACEAFVVAYDAARAAQDRADEANRGIILRDQGDEPRSAAFDEHMAAVEAALARVEAAVARAERLLAGDAP